MRLTYHLVSADTWAEADPDRPYEAASLATEGFIHCTDGMDELVATANRHYDADPRPFLILTVDLDEAGSQWRIDDPGQIYPHVFGSIDRRAILRAIAAPRGGGGEFVAFEA